MAVNSRCMEGKKPGRGMYALGSLNQEERGCEKKEGKKDSFHCSGCLGFVGTYSSRYASNGMSMIATRFEPFEFLCIDGNAVQKYQ